MEIPVKYRILKFIGHQDWLTLGVRLRLINFFRKNSDLTFITNFFGLKYQGNLNSYIDSNIYFLGAYEKLNLHLLKQISLLFDQPIFLDVGANVGNHSLFMTQYCKHVHSIEPFNKVYKHLEKNIVLNSIENIDIHKLAFGKVTSTQQYFPPDNINEGTGTFKPNDKEERNRIPIEVKIANGDAYLKSKSITTVNIIKIDVEGFEPEVLQGLQKTIASNRSVIMFEFSEKTKKRINDKSRLTKLFPDDYVIKKITPSGRKRLKLADFHALNKSADYLAYPKEMTKKINHEPI